MAPKNTASGSKKTKKKEAQQITTIRKLFIFVLMLLCLVIIIVISFKFHFIEQKYSKIKKQPARVEHKAFKVKKPKPVKKKKAKQIKKEKPLYEIYPDKEIKHKGIKKKNNVSFPEVAIIIDDIGFDKDNARALMELDVPITLSVLPFTPFGKSLIDNCKNKKIDFMLHLPMQPEEYPRIDPGKGALLESMSADQLIAQLEKDINWFPCLKGLNNHMGSLLTQDPDKMNQIFSILKKKDLFFIDSMTSSKSMGESSAFLFRIPFAKRDIFLDNIQQEKYITGQLDKLYEVARNRGYAIGIGHPYDATVKSLEHHIPILSKKVKFVKASTLVKIPSQ